VLVERLASNWWALGLRGILAIVFGLLAFAWPAITADVLVAFFGAYALVDGVFALIAALRSGHLGPRWWSLVAEGVVGIAIALVAFFLPAVATLWIVWVIALWAIVTGLLKIATAFRLRAEIENEWSMGLSGLGSVVFGLLLAAWPGAGIVAVIWLIGAYAIMYGLLLLWLAFRLRAGVIGSPTPV
jgi:uncharacterized membrane protein HdeD (DUF308 family)